jgi:hypothetical protein
MGQISVTLKADHTLGSISGRVQPTEAATVSVAGTKTKSNVQVVGTSEERLELGDVGVGGWLWIINRDTTNFVSLRAATGETNLCKLLPGDPPMWLRISPDATPYVIADTASCELEYRVYEL